MEIEIIKCLDDNYSYIIFEKKTNTVSIVDPSEFSQCDKAIQKYKRLDYTEPFSYLDLYPLTGRTHQLRVHLKKIGHPIIMDEVYGGSYKIAQSFHQKQEHH